MRKLIILAAIITVTSLYFVVDARQYLSFQNKSFSNGEVAPLGTDVVDLAAKKLPEIIQNIKDSGQKLSGNNISASAIDSLNLSDIPAKAGSFAAQAVTSVKDAVSNSIQQKIDQTFCSQK